MTDVLDDKNSTDFLCGLMNCTGFPIQIEEEEHTDNGPRPEYYFVPIVFFIIFLVGFLGNGSLVFFFFRYPKMRKPPNTYIFSLALGDLLVILFCVPFVSVIYTTTSWPFGESICKISEGIKELSIGITVFTLTALSAERFMAIVSPVSMRASNHSALKAIIVIWLISILFAIPTSLISHVKEFHGGNNTVEENNTIFICYPFPDYIGGKPMPKYFPKVVVLVKLLIFYAIPLLLIGTFYCLMARQLLRTASALPGEASQQCHRTTQIEARRKVAKMVVAFVFLFAICFLPNHVFLMWYYYNENSKDDFNIFWNYFRIIGFCLAFFNSCINPVALYWVSGTFRKYFNQNLFCLTPLRPLPQDRSTTHIRFNSSAAGANMTTRSEQFDMSTYNNCQEKSNF